ncbi:Sapep family Mn(2+)-dependent dipeptidase [Spiroplasma endosymbiont of Aspidapion aeneum]|uniref:Sapep family Mn(2+)-dependent dipeptidase n=1 Tax=Spiroplasma endosymbiont of Aspidapion aeneum TaxID=3066276 RepID=UPI00313C83B5
MKVDNKDLLEKYYKEIVEKIRDLVKFESVKVSDRREKSTNIEPGRTAALNYVINLCKSWGWETKISKDGLYGYADIGSGEKLFGILCHLDVVPAGDLEEWNYPPFELTETKTHLYGRGVFDDKGPTVVNLYALKYLLENGFVPDYTVRFIFGTAEETNWECLNSYVKNERLVDVGYTPDGAFPCVYAEKFILNYDLTGNFNCDFTIKGGECYNAVVDLITYSGPLVYKLLDYFKDIKEIKLTKKDGNLIIKGKSSHASLPQLSVCASTYLAKALKDLGVNHPAINYLADHLYLQNNGRSLFDDLTDESGDLTICNGIINIDKSKFMLTLDMRVPVTRNCEDDITKKLEKYCAKNNINVVLSGSEGSVYHKQDSKLVQDTLNAYRQVTGIADAKPLAIGGGTFAKAMPNVIAFGAEKSMEDCSMHIPNENISIADLKMIIQIYANAMVKLLKI